MSHRTTKQTIKHVCSAETLKIITIRIFYLNSFECPLENLLNNLTAHRENTDHSWWASRLIAVFAECTLCLICQAEAKIKYQLLKGNNTVSIEGKNIFSGLRSINDSGLGSYFSG